MRDPAACAKGKGLFDDAIAGVKSSGKAIKDKLGRFIGKKKKQPQQFKIGLDVEKDQLAKRGITDYKQKLFRPDAKDVNSKLFKEIVGKPKYTKSGKLYRGTKPDYQDERRFVEEIKSGDSILNISYQLRLQVYLAVKTNRKFVLTTNRKLSPKLEKFLKKYNTKTRKLK